MASSALVACFWSCCLIVILGGNWAPVANGEYHEGLDMDDEYVPIGLVDQYPNRDCLQGNLTGPLNATRFKCYKLCLEVKGCDSFQYYNMSQNCYLKTKFCKLQQLVVIVGGDYFVLRSEKVPKAKLYDQRDCYGSSIGPSIQFYTKRSQCYNRCKAVKGCRSFTFDLTNGQCFTKSSVCKAKEMRIVGYLEYYVM